MTTTRRFALALVALLSACTVPAETGPTTPTTPAPNDAVAGGGSFESEHVHQEAQVRIWVPEQWKVDNGTDDLLIITDPAGELSILFAVVEGEDLLGALALVAGGVLSELDDVQLTGDPLEANFNGMDAVIQDGAAVLEGVDVELSLGVILTPANKFLVVVGLAESATLTRHADTLTKIITGLKPLDG